VRGKFLSALEGSKSRSYRMEKEKKEIKKATEMFINKKYSNFHLFDNRMTFINISNSHILLQFKISIPFVIVEEFINTR
jgi:hypothetical protein